MYNFLIERNDYFRQEENKEKIKGKKDERGKAIVEQSFNNWAREDE